MGDDGKFTSVKLLLIGDSGVGKTAIMLQFSENTFSETFITTVGIDYKYKFVTLTNKETNKEEKNPSRDLGHCWAGKIQGHHTVISAWS